VKLALCNEVLQHLDFEDQCRAAAQMGYQGLELAPFTLAQDATELTPALARSLRAVAASHGLAISSLHWLLVKPAGLSIVTPDAECRGRTIQFLVQLLDFAAEAGCEVLVHGSPAQRSPQAGQSVADALARAQDAWHQVGQRAHALGLCYCIEPLRRAVTPIINTVQEAIELIERVGCPGLRTMLDVSAACAEELDTPAQLLRRHVPDGFIRHVQLNDANRRGPGQGDTPIKPVLNALRDTGYCGWVAVEPFEFHPTPLDCARASAAHAWLAWSALQDEPAGGNCYPRN
jgi:sugar phosphate isomerase/epimerase